MPTRIEYECPWVGPRPYEERDAKSFHGREEDIERLVDKLVGQNITILAADSGAGKTSLIRAGLIPKLRRDRLHRGPVLVLRDWGGLGCSWRPAELILAAIHGAVKQLDDASTIPDYGSDLTKQLKKDAKAFRKVLAESGRFKGRLPDIEDGARKTQVVFDLVHSLCNQTGRLILIIDQAEELLGSGQDHIDSNIQKEVQNILGTIFLHEKRVNMLISLRDEGGMSLKAMGALEKYVGSLGDRMKSLTALNRDQIRSVLLRTKQLSRKKEDAITEDVIEDVLDSVEETNADQSIEPHCDLFLLQALLRGIWEHARTIQPIGPVTITQQSFESYRTHCEIEKNAPMADKVLMRHINGVFDKLPVRRGPTFPSIGLMKRIAAGMAPHLSTPGGFKKHMEGADLILSAIEGDLKTLAAYAGGLTEQKDSLLDAIGWMSRKEDTTKGTDVLRNVFPNKEQDDERPLCSGAKWDSDNSATAKFIINAAWTVLKHLQSDKANVIKPGIGRQAKGDKIGVGVQTFELVHDRLGPALKQWQRRRAIEDDNTLASVVASLGTTFDWKKLTNRPNGEDALAHLRWRGCTFNGVVFDNLWFEECDLRGCIFTDCQLNNVTFHNCNLSGAIFASSDPRKKNDWTNVEFSGDKGMADTILLKRVRWQRNQPTTKNAEADLAQCKWRNATFVLVDFDRLCFSKEADLSGALFEACTLKACTLEGIVLNGAIIRGGSFATVTVKNCKAKALLVKPIERQNKVPAARVKWKDVHITDTDLESAGIFATDWTGRRSELMHKLIMRGGTMTGVTCENLAFDRSRLSGLALIECELIDCKFLNCKLDGAVVRKGSWENINWSICLARGMVIIGVRWKKKITIEHTDFEAVSFKDIDIVGQTILADVSLRFGQIDASVGSGGKLSVATCDVFRAGIAEEIHACFDLAQVKNGPLNVNAPYAGIPNPTLKIEPEKT